MKGPKKREASRRTPHPKDMEVVRSAGSLLAEAALRAAMNPNQGERLSIADALDTPVNVNHETSV
jgi:hypothetical protein